MAEQTKFQSQHLAADGLLKWIDDQRDVDWVIATLRIQGKTMSEREQLGKVLNQTIRRFEYKTLGGNAVNRRGEHLRCVAFFGGNPGTGVFLHYHLLLEKRTRKPMDLETFRMILEVEWKKQLPRLRRWNALTDQITGDVWMEASTPNVNGYINYVQRFEGSTLGYGIDKVDVKNLFLT
jgi:hypothetical protein